MMKKFFMFSILALFGIICGCGAKQDDSDLQCSDKSNCEIGIEAYENADENVELPPIAEDNTDEESLLDSGAGDEV